MTKMLAKISRAKLPRALVAPSRPARALTVRPLAQQGDPRQEPSTVNMRLQALNFKLSDSIKTYTTEKLSKALNPFEAEVKEAEVRFELHDKNHGQTHGSKQKVEVILRTLHNGTVVLTETEDDLYAAIDMALDKVKTKMRKVKEMGVEKGKWPGRAGKGAAIDGVLAEEEDVDEEEVITAASKAGELGPFKK